MVVVLVLAAGSVAGCVNYDPQPVSHPTPPIRPGYSTAPGSPPSAVSPTPSSTWTPAGAPTWISPPPVIEWVKLTPEIFNPDCDRDYTVVPVVTAKVSDPDTPLPELRVTAQWDGGNAHGELRMTFDPRRKLFTAALPRIRIHDVIGPNNNAPSAMVVVTDPRRDGPGPQPVTAFSYLGCIWMGTIQNHA